MPLSERDTELLNDEAIEQLDAVKVTLRAHIADDEVFALQSQYYKKYYDALIAAGFIEEEALKILIGTVIIKK